MKLASDIDRKSSLGDFGQFVFDRTWTISDPASAERARCPVGTTLYAVGTTLSRIAAGET
jgi:hypothetical protein